MEDILKEYVGYVLTTRDGVKVFVTDATEELIGVMDKVVYKRYKLIKISTVDTVNDPSDTNDRRDWYYSNGKVYRDVSSYRDIDFKVNPIYVGNPR